MALYKQIKQPDGVTTSYHRVLYVMLTTNKQNSIAVSSYVDDEARNAEKENASQPYTQSITYETTYDPEMTIERAYAYLKTLPEYEDSIDV